MAALNVDDFPATAALFPIKLFRMVCDPQCRCMTWGGDGEHLILNTRLFEDELLQQTLARWKYQLKTTSTTSFIRQLHAYGFRKVVEGFGEPNNIRRYYHPYFHRQRPDLLVYMKRNLRSSGGPKKHPLQMFDDPTKTQNLVSSILNQSMPGLIDNRNSPSNNTPGRLDKSNQERMNSSFPFSINSLQFFKSGEANQGGSENVNKRRRKAPPRKHPSFEEPCDVEEEEDLSPPSMVSRLPYKGGPLPRMYPMIMGGEFPDTQMQIVKQEEKNDQTTFQNAYLKELTQAPAQTEMSSMVEELPKKQNEEEDVAEKPIPMENDVKKENSQIDETMTAPLTFPRSQTKKEINKMEIDEPLDLSLPRPGKLFTVKSLVPVSAKNVKSLILPPSKLPRMVSKGNSNFMQQQGQDRSAFVIDNERNKPPILSHHKPPSSNSFYGQMGEKMFSTGTGLPPFPTNNPRINVPPHSVLQPAYIAWPTRGVFCPQTKQWIHSRPTIIPLPLRNQHISPRDQGQGPLGSKLASALPPWFQDSTKILQDEKDLVKMEPVTVNQEGMKSPAVHA